LVEYIHANWRFAMNESRSLVIRGSKIFEDAYGHICLDDLWRAAKARPSKEPSRWRITRMAKALAEELSKKTVLSGLKENRPDIPVIYALRGRGRTGTFAHPILAAAYAGYLSPKLELEVREIWLRYRAGDTTLADEILQRATAEENKWVGLRALARGRRLSYTGVLKDHGVDGKGYMNCTEAVYMGLLGGKSFQLRAQRGLPAKANLRNHMDQNELAFIAAAEALSSDRIIDENRQGNQDCAVASNISASAIRRAIEEDRSNRQKTLV